MYWKPVVRLVFLFLKFCFFDKNLIFKTHTPNFLGVFFLLLTKITHVLVV